MIPINDNTAIHGVVESLVRSHHLENCRLADLPAEDLLLLPSELSSSADLQGEDYLFKSQGGQIYTTNLVGVIKIGDTQIRIGSRFYDTQGNADFFLRYLIQRVGNFDLTLQSVNTSSEESGYRKLLIMLFPEYLKHALEKGLYKEYVERKYNDANVRGPIDVARHLRENVPFRGRIAYRTREFSYDNGVTELIRHTLEKISHLYDFSFFSESGFKHDIAKIQNCTSSYSRHQRNEIVRWNVQHPIKHGYFEPYYPLQQLCIKILQDEAVSFGDTGDQVNGIIVDIAWLWEEYINTLIDDPLFTHAENKASKLGFSMYKDWNHVIYPDFYSSQRGVVLDAKYKNLDGNSRYINREDLYQIISYLHLLKSSRTGVIYPSADHTQIYHVGQLVGLGGKVFKIGLLIPKSAKNYDDFCQKIRKQESVLKKLGIADLKDLDE